MEAWWNNQNQQATRTSTHISAGCGIIHNSNRAIGAAVAQVLYTHKVSGSNPLSRTRNSRSESNFGSDLFASSQRFKQNRSLKTATTLMLAVKKRFDKDSGIVAYHAYQSFMLGETTPKQARQIGREVARRLWQDGYEVAVATRPDKAHVHNHFVVNSVSYVDGEKFRNEFVDYYRLRDESDKLCREYGPSVIYGPQYGQVKNHAEWLDGRAGKPTWRSIIKTDVGEATDRAFTDKDFYRNLKNLGYEVKFVGDGIEVHPTGKERFLRLERNLGGRYSEEGICERILSRFRPVATIPAWRLNYEAQQALEPVPQLLKKQKSRADRTR